MSNPLDPLTGWFDRMVAEGDEQKLRMLRNIYPVVMGEFGETFDPEKHKERCIAHGYGSRETMDILWPEQASGEGSSQAPEGGE